MKSNNEKFILLNKWTSNQLDLTEEKYPPNPTYEYQTFERINQPPTDIPTKIHYMRKAAEVHRQVRKYVQNIIQPNIKLIDICNTIESKTVELFQRNDIIAGIGFPTGVSINHIAAHDSANPNDTRTLKKNDVCKIDFGTHCNGYIIDSAFTVCFDPTFEPLLQATKDGTWTGIKMSGIDARINEISQQIQEAIESYEIELNNKIYPIKAIKNLGGHNIEQYKIHAGKLVLSAPHPSIPESLKMKENECYAIETFASTGSDNVKNDDNLPCNHFMRTYNTTNKDTKFKLDITKKTYTYINKHRTTLPFASRWLNDTIGSSYSVGLSDLKKRNLVDYYPPLVVKPGEYTSQLEHTIYLHEFGKEVLSQGDDY